MKTVVDIKLEDTLPRSISSDKKVSAAAAAIDPHLQFIGKAINTPMIYLYLAKLSSVQLDHLAAGFNVTPWRDYWSVALKRSAIIANFDNKRKRGTLSAVKKAVESLGSAVYITEWHKQTPPGTPGTFRIVATYFDGSTSDEEAQEDVIKAVEDAKPFTRHFELIMAQSAKGGINVYGCIRPMTVVKLHNT